MILKKLAYHSYTLVKTMAILILFLVVALNYLFKIEISPPIIAIFFFLEGIYVGYTIAYYSIKYLKNESLKKKLPLN